MIFSATSLGVFIPEITSTNFITGAGLKKCIPITGLPIPAPISVIEREEVFEENKQSDLQISCNSLNVVFFTSILSKAASTIKSQSLQMSFKPTEIFEIILSASLLSILPFATLPSKLFTILALPLAANSSVISHKQTS